MGETFFTTIVVFIISNSENKEKSYDDDLDVNFEAELKIILLDKEVIEFGIQEQILRDSAYPKVNELFLILMTLQLKLSAIRTVSS